MSNSNSTTLVRHLKAKAAFYGVRRNRRADNYTPREYAATILIDAGVLALRNLENEMPDDTASYRKKVKESLQKQIGKLADRYKLDVVIPE